MKIFKGWFFYLIIAVLMVIIATLTSSYYSSPGKKNPEKFNLLEKIPTYNLSFNFDFYKKLFSKEKDSEKKENIASSTASSTSEKLIENAKQVAEKISTEAPEKLASSGVESKLFNYISEKKPFFEKNGFYFSEGDDQKWDFGFWSGKKQIKLFSLKQ